MIDHIAFAVPDLTWGIEYIKEKTGIQPVIGGQHQGLGSWNALLSLGPEVYLEIIAPDPKQAIKPVWLGLKDLQSPKLTRWAAKSDRIDLLYDAAKKMNINIGSVSPYQRIKGDGSLLSWKLSDPLTDTGDGLIPFFIDWGNSAHPELDLEKGCELISLEGIHPEPDRIQKVNDLLKVSIPIHYGANPQLIARINTPKGLIELK